MSDYSADIVGMLTAREQAIAIADGQWTEHTFQCRSCNKRTRASRGAIQSYRENLDCDGLTDAEIVESFEFCLRCVTGEIHVGEHVCHQCGGGGVVAGRQMLAECPICRNWLCLSCAKEPCDHGPAAVPR